MVKLKTSTRIALYAIFELGRRPDELLTAAELAQRYRVSQHHAAKVLQQMARAGLARSVRGVGGGFQIARDPREITMFDVVSIFDPPTAPAGKTDSESAEESSSDPASLGKLQVGNVLAEVEEQAFYTLRSISVATLIAPRRLQ